MSAPRTIYIAGAGVSGLTLALALAKFGAHVVVIERNETVSEFGAGLQISPNARRCLDRLGLTDALTEASFEPQGIDIFPDGREKPLQTLTLGKAIRDRFGAPYAVMHRGDLVSVLHTAARRFANIDILFGIDNFLVEESADNHLSLSLTETDGKQRRARPFAFIGADGVRSATRTRLLGGPQAEYAGRVAWRTLIAPEKLAGLLDLTRTSVLMGTRFHLVVYPLPHRDAVNLVLFTDEPEDDLPNLHTRAAPPLKPRGNRRLAAILDLVGSNWTPWVLATVETDIWHKGAIGLIGDAAHAMLPFQAQGAAMGIEDAAVLAPLLVSAPNPAHALTRYAALRQERVRRVQQVSAANGRIFHMGWPATLARNAVIAAQGPEGHFRRLDWLYGYDPQATQS